jgi:uncharacterized protein involved in exopolysaccharide biosynthesis
MNPESNSQYLDRTERPFHEDEIDLRELLIALWRGKICIIGIAFIAAVISVFVALGLPNIYRAEVLIAVDEEGSGGLSGLASQYSGIASLAGISLPAGVSSEKDISLAKLQSRQFLAGFVERRGILPDLMAANTFDWISGEVGYNENIYDIDEQIWTRSVQAPLTDKPSPQEAYEALRGVLTVEEDTRTGFITISVDHISPIVAQQWVTWMVSDLNEEMMLDATTEAQQSIDYLTDQLRNTQIVALEEVFYSLIEEQTKTIMLANSRSEYLFQTIDPAVVPEVRFSPNRALICVLGTLLGGMLSVLGVLIWHYAFKSKGTLQRN